MDEAIFQATTDAALADANPFVVNDLQEHGHRSMETRLQQAREVCLCVFAH